MWGLWGASRFSCGLVMIDLGPDFPIECDDFARWPGAYAACETLSRGETLVNATAMVHTLTGLTLRPEHRWHFMQVGLPRLELKHGDLHAGSSVTARSCPAQRRPRPPCASASGWTARPPLAPSGPPSGRRGRGRSKGTWALHRLREASAPRARRAALRALRVWRGVQPLSLCVSSFVCSCCHSEFGERYRTCRNVRKELRETRVLQRQSEFRKSVIYVKI